MYKIRLLNIFIHFIDTTRIMDYFFLLFLFILKLCYSGMQIWSEFYLIILKMKGASIFSKNNIYVFAKVLFLSFYSDIYIVAI